MNIFPRPTPYEKVAYNSMERARNEPTCNNVSL